MAQTEARKIWEFNFLDPDISGLVKDSFSFLGLRKKTFN